MGKRPCRLGPAPRDENIWVRDGREDCRRVLRSPLFLGHLRVRSRRCGLSALVPRAGHGDAHLWVRLQPRFSELLRVAGFGLCWFGGRLAASCQARELACVRCPRFFCHAGASDWLPLLARNGWVPLFARDASCPLEVARSVSRRWRVCRAAPRSGSSARLAGGLEQGKAVLFLHGSGPADSLWPALRNAFVHRARFRCCLLYRGIRRPREATLLDASIPLARTVCCCLPRHRSPARESSSIREQRLDWLACLPAYRHHCDLRPLCACLAPSAHLAICGILGSGSGLLFVPLRRYGLAQPAGIQCGNRAG